jgi:hypothetical protein
MALPPLPLQHNALSEREEVLPIHLVFSCSLVQKGAETRRA